MPRLRKDSPAMKLLNQMFEHGDIKGNEPPKQVWQSHKLFQQHKLANFRAQYYLLRKKYEQLQKESSNVLNRRCTNSESEEHNDRTENIAEDESAPIPAREGVEYVLGLNEFKPLYLIGEWNDPKTTLRRLSVAMVLPSGVEKGKFGMHIVENGNVLELRVAWPRPLLDVEFLHKQWLEKKLTTTDHPKFSGFNCALKLFRERSSDEVYSTARIPLLFPVHCHVLEKANLGWIGDSTKVVYIDLEQAVVEEYSKLNDNDDFIVS